MGNSAEHYAACCSLKSYLKSLTSDVREAIKIFLPAVWANAGVFYVFIQAGFAEDSPTIHHLVWIAGYMKADLTDQFVWWCLHKLAISHICHSYEYWNPASYTGEDSSNICFQQCTVTIIYGRNCSVLCM